MSAAQLIGWAGSLLVIGTYIIATKSDRPTIFHWGNAIGCFPLLVSGLAVGAYPQCFITAAFGITGWFGVWRSRK